MKTVLTLLFAALLFFSCEKDPGEEVNTLGSAVRVSLAEYTDARGHNLTFKFLTDKDFPCINYQISQQTAQAGNLITISLQKIEKADVCLDAIGPATAFVDLGSLAEGEYDLVINLGKSMSSNGKLQVTEKAYQVDMEASEGLVVEQNILRRIPEHMIWGTIRYTRPSEDNALYQKLITSLQHMGATEKRLPEGYYQYFSIDAGGRLRMDNAGETEETFMMEYGGSHEQIQSMLQQMQQTHGENAIIRIYNAAGEELKTRKF